METESRKLALIVSKEAANAGINVYYLLARAHIDKSTFYRWRRGDAQPNHASLQKLHECQKIINSVDAVIRLKFGGHHAA